MGMTIFPYGLAVAAAIIVALLLAGVGFRRAGLSVDALSVFAVLALPLGFLCARLGYCLAAWDWVKQEGIAFFFQFSRGGYMLYGALAGALLAAALTARLSGVRFAKMADALAMPALVLVALGRLAEGLVEQGYGWGIADWFTEDYGMSLFALEDPSFFFRLPFGVPDMYGNYNWAVFVFEALVACGLALAVSRARVRRAGGRAAWALLLYAAAQELCESLRQDAVLRWGFVRINQVLGAVVIVALMALCYGLAQPRKPKRLILSVVGVVLGALLITAMEFALEKKFSALEWVPMDVCYVFTALGCLLMILSVYPLWRAAFGHGAIRTEEPVC